MSERERARARERERESERARERGLLTRSARESERARKKVSDRGKESERERASERARERDRVCVNLSMFACVRGCLRVCACMHLSLSLGPVRPEAVLPDRALR